MMTIWMVPPLVVCAVIVLESNVVAASGGLPVALAVTFHVPRIEPAMATEPAPLAMVVGAQPVPKISDKYHSRRRCNRRPEQRGDEQRCSREYLSIHTGVS